MKLFLLRHGDAELGSPDSHRRLSALGYEQIVKTSDKHRVHCADVQLVLSSPLQRALQSADLFMAQTMLDCPRQTVDFLQPESSVNKVVQWLQAMDYSCLLMVGHLPMLDKLINYLTADMDVRMETAGLASLSMDYPLQGLATLNWVHYPKSCS